MVSCCNPKRCYSSATYAVIPATQLSTSELAVSICLHQQSLTAHASCLSHALLLLLRLSFPPLLSSTSNTLRDPYTKEQNLSSSVFWPIWKHAGLVKRLVPSSCQLISSYMTALAARPPMYAVTTRWSV